MAVRKIVQIPEKVLTEIAKAVETGEDVTELAKDLMDTLDASVNPKGAGIAAPQLGVSKRVCVVKKFTPDPARPGQELETSFILINPEIMTHSDSTHADWEGCLSIPDTYGKVERFKRVKVRALDLQGNVFTMKAEGFFARVIQHEIDHLNGILFNSKIIGKIYTEKELDALFKEEKND